MIGWQYKPIGKVVKRIATGSTPSTSHPEFFGGQIPWFTPGDIGSTRNLIESSRYITEKALSDGKARLFEGQTLLVTCIGDIGRVGILQVPASSNQQITALKFNDEVDVYYAYYWFIAHQHKLESQATQAVVPILNNARLKQIDFSYPPLPEQKRIAAILAKADRLRRLRRTARDLSNTYLQSVFLEMFGDPVSNPIGWRVAKLKSQIRHIDSGWSPVCGETRTSDEQWAVLRLGAVTSGIYLPDENKQLLPSSEPRPSLEVKKGDVLITRKNTVDLVAACAFVHHTPPKLMLPDTIFRFVFREDSQVRSEYLWGLFSEKAFRKKVQSLATGTAGSMPNISKEKLLGVEILLPPVPLQQEFARIVHKLERLRAQQREAQRQAEHLFQTLLHRAFRGELEDPKGLGDP